MCCCYRGVYSVLLLQRGVQCVVVTEGCTVCCCYRGVYSVLLLQRGIWSLAGQRPVPRSQPPVHHLQQHCPQRQ